MKQIKVLANNKVPIVGEKIFLTNIEADELVKVKMSAKEEGFEKFTCRPVHNISDEERVNRYKALIENDNICIFGIYDKPGRNILGHISIFDYNPRNRSVEVGYYLMKEFRNNGFMKEAVNLLSKFLFEEVKLNKIMAQTGSFNYESNYLLKSCGFKLDGCLREHHELDGRLYDDNIYSILKGKDEKRKNL